MKKLLLIALALVFAVTADAQSLKRNLYVVDAAGNLVIIEAPPSLGGNTTFTFPTTSGTLLTSVPLVNPTDPTITKFGTAGNGTASSGSQGVLQMFNGSSATPLEFKTTGTGTFTFPSPGLGLLWSAANGDISFTAGAANKYLKMNATANGFEWVDISTALGATDGTGESVEVSGTITGGSNASNGMTIENTTTGTSTGTKTGLVINSTGSWEGDVAAGDAPNVGLDVTVSDGDPNIAARFTGGNIQMRGGKAVELWDPSDDNYSSLQAGEQTENVSYVLPTTAATEGQVLTAGTPFGSDPTTIPLEWSDGTDLSDVIRTTSNGAGQSITSSGASLSAPSGGLYIRNLTTSTLSTEQKTGIKVTSEGDWSSGPDVGLHVDMTNSTANTKFAAKFSGAKVQIASGNLELTTGSITLGTGGVSIDQGDLTVADNDISIYGGHNLNLYETGSIKFWNATSDKYSLFQAGAQTQNFSYTWPTTLAAEGQVLTVGTVTGTDPFIIPLEWATPGGGTLTSSTDDGAGQTVTVTGEADASPSSGFTIVNDAINDDANNIEKSGLTVISQNQFDGNAGSGNSNTGINVVVSGATQNSSGIEILSSGGTVSNVGISASATGATVSAVGGNFAASGGTTSNVGASISATSDVGSAATGLVVSVAGGGTNTAATFDGGNLVLTNGNFVGNGSGLTNLNAANLTGTINDARLSTNVPLKDGTNVFTGTNTFSTNPVTINSSLKIKASDGAHYTTLQGGAQGSNDFTWTMPTTAGADGEYLKMGTGNQLAWSTISSALGAADGTGESVGVSGTITGGSNASNGMTINNTTTGTSTGTKTGLVISSTGSWAGTGVANDAPNVGLDVTVSGGDPNIAAKFTGGNIQMRGGKAVELWDPSDNNYSSIEAAEQTQNFQYKLPATLATTGQLLAVGTITGTDPKVIPLEWTSAGGGDLSSTSTGGTGQSVTVSGEANSSPSSGFTITNNATNPDANNLNKNGLTVVSQGVFDGGAGTGNTNTAINASATGATQQATGANISATGGTVSNTGVTVSATGATVTATGGSFTASGGTTANLALSGTATGAGTATSNGGTFTSSNTGSGASTGSTSTSTGGGSGTSTGASISASGSSTSNVGANITATSTSGNTATGLNVSVSGGGTNTAASFAGGPVKVIGTSTEGGSVRYYEPTASGNNYSSFEAVAQATDIQYKLPATQGTAGQSLNISAIAGTDPKVVDLTWGDVAAATLSNTAAAGNSAITAINSGNSGTIGVARGGTGAGSFTAGGVIYGNSTSPLGASAAGSSGDVLRSGGSGAPTWSTPSSSSGASTLVIRDVSGNFAGNVLSAVATSNQLVLGTTNTTTISATAPATSRTYTLPDAGSNANFILSASGTAGQSVTASGAATTASPAFAITNSSTSSTNNIAKTGLSVTSTGSWTGATANNTALSLTASGSSTTNRGLDITATGGSTANGLNVSVSGGTANYAATFTGGNVGIGTTTPDAALSVATAGTASVPALRLASGAKLTSNKPGGIAYDGSYLYYYDASGNERQLLYSGGTSGTGSVFNDVTVTGGTLSGGGTQPGLHMDGSIAIRSTDVSVTTLSGASNILDPGKYGSVRITGAGPATVAGIQRGYHGKRLRIYNGTTGTNNITIKNLGGANGSGGNQSTQILTLADADVTLLGAGASELIFDTNASTNGAWVVATTLAKSTTGSIGTSEFARTATLSGNFPANYDTTTLFFTVGPNQVWEISSNGTVNSNSNSNNFYIGFAARKPDNSNFTSGVTVTINAAVTSGSGGNSSNFFNLAGLVTYGTAGSTTNTASVPTNATVQVKMDGIIITDGTVPAGSRIGIARASSATTTMGANTFLRATRRE